MLKRKTKKKINTSHISFGFLLLLFGWWGIYEAGRDDVEAELLQTISITTKSISKLYGRNKSSEYIVTANETPVVFEIDVPGAIAAIRSNLDEIRKGDSLTIQTYYYLLEKDNDAGEHATVFFLEHNGRLLFNANGYNKAQDAY